MWDGTFTPRVSNCWKDGVDTAILDGEMVPWDPETETRGACVVCWPIKVRLIKEHLCNRECDC